MSRIFHRPKARMGSYLALAAFAVAYLSALTFVLVPGLVAP